ncbi:hypothetical protein BP5796_04988 [Coleophoma crateriformis]|uniref:Uncharacterized protein n=1 Tax=Coleophoma crateriformis TaxID=565419 RepID=A0A3D8SAV6_9HELO|nr:hypothetical protein BP5796_04988 [Coleophoma crateriformis]
MDVILHRNVRCNVSDVSIELHFVKQNSTALLIIATKSPAYMAPRDKETTTRWLLDVISLLYSALLALLNSLAAGTGTYTDTITDPTPDDIQKIIGSAKLVIAAEQVSGFARFGDGTLEE